MDKYLSLSHRLDYILIIYCWAVSQIAPTVQSLEICAVCTSRGPAAPTNPQASGRPSLTSLTSSLSIPSIPSTPSITSITSITNPQAQGRPSLTSSLVLFLVQLCYGCTVPHLHSIFVLCKNPFLKHCKNCKSPHWQINVSWKKSLHTALLRT